MSQAKEDRNRAVEHILEDGFDLVPTKSGKGRRVRLEVWEAKGSGAQVGLEMEHEAVINIWMKRTDVPAKLPANSKRTDKEPDRKEWTDERGDGANSNLSFYPAFVGHPVTRLGVPTAGAAGEILGALAAAPLRPSGTAHGNTFLVKINGDLHGPNYICRPESAGAWEGEELHLVWEGPRPSSYLDHGPGPMIAPGDLLYIWAHEDEAFGNGFGLTATAIAGEIRSGNDRLHVRLENVWLLPRPFGFRLLGTSRSGSAILQAIDADRSPRAWVMDAGEQEIIDALIDTFGSQHAAAVAAAEAQYLDEWAIGLRDDKGAIDDEIEARRTALSKARPEQAMFRAKAMDRHGGRCVVTRTVVAVVLEAAHVIPHTGRSLFERPDNSLVLRRDIHALYDRFLISINPKSGKLVVSDTLGGTSYEKLAGRLIDHKLAGPPLEFHHRQFTRAHKQARELVGK